ncbi:MAG: amidohydrolase [Myxococcota bacterium]|nr:amidohydrolase [Myxococcota bacterium]
MPESRCSRTFIAYFLACWIALPSIASETDDAFVRQWVASELDEIEMLYRELHASPELSRQEHATAARVAAALEAAGYEVTTGVGETGVVGVLRNGEGPTLLIRGDMDGLPVREETGLSYASRVRASGSGGVEVGVMHACGHDVHTSNLIASAELLAVAAASNRWSGTLVIVAQPAEEIGWGALAMIEDGLFERFPVPDVAIALHVDGDFAAGDVAITPGWAAANVDSVDITLYGRGGHGARPHQAVDPIVAAAHLVTALQTLVSRRVAPQDPAVVTVGSIHGGTKSNVIPDEVKLQLTVRSYSDEVRSQLMDGIAQLAADTCRTFECTRPADVVSKENYTPAVFNDVALSGRARVLFIELLGADHVHEKAPGMGGEDFGRFPRLLEIPGLQYRLGTADPEALAAAREAGETLPSLHSSRYAPLARPTLETGVRTLTNLALAILGGSPSASGD